MALMRERVPEWTRVGVWTATDQGSVGSATTQTEPTYHLGLAIQAVVGGGAVGTWLSIEVVLIAGDLTFDW